MPQLLPKKTTFVLYVYRDLMAYLLNSSAITRAECDEWWRWFTDKDTFMDRTHVHIPIGYWGWRCSKCKSDECDDRLKRLHRQGCDALDDDEEQNPPSDPETLRLPGQSPPAEALRDVVAFKVLSALEQFSELGNLVVFMEIS